jgi:pSer/pThr/pTyr-binding forkhead associated (FHA) protein
MEMKYNLRYLTDPYLGLMVDFDQNIVSVGRAVENDMVIEEPHVSGFHARLVQRDGRVFIEDLGSTNGTFVNGKRVKTPMQLTQGSVVQFGTRTQVTFTLQGDLEDRTVVAVPSALPDYVEPETAPKSERLIPIWALFLVLGLGLSCVVISVILLVIIL